jgi:hypothetical protein
LSEVTEFASDVDAVIGLDMLHLARRLRIDFAQQLLTFQMDAVGSSVDILNTRAPILHLNVQGRQLCLVMDTGVQDIVLYKDRIHKHSPHLKLSNRVTHAYQGRLAGQTNGNPFWNSPRFHILPGVSFSD